MRVAASIFVPLADRDMRFRVEETIERLIEILDAWDDDPDLEETEPAEEGDNGIADEGGRQEVEGEKVVCQWLAEEQWSGDKRHHRKAKSDLRKIRNRRARA